MKWSEFKKLVDTEVSRSSGLSIYNPFDPEIEYIDIGAEWITLDDLHVYFEDGKLSITN